MSEPRDGFNVIELDPYQSSFELTPEHVNAILIEIGPLSRLSAADIAKRIGTALFTYWAADTVKKLFPETGATAEHRKQIGHAANHLRHLLYSDATLAALKPGWTALKIFGADDLGKICKQLEGLLGVVIEAESARPRPGRGGKANQNMDDLVRELACIFADATGKPLTRSRNALGAVSGHWLDFWAVATGAGVLDGHTIFYGHPPTLDAVEKRTTRLGLFGQRSAARRNDGNTHNVAECDILEATKELPDAKSTRSSDSNNRGSPRPRPEA